MRSAVLIALILGSIWPATTGQAAEATAKGLWERTDRAGKPDGWFRVAERGGIYEGQLIKVFPEPGEDPASWRCTKCEGDRKDAPVLGITIIKGMKRQGLAYGDGNILDPRDGSIYKARMELSPDGQQLSVRGYLGISLLGRTEVWNRLPDNALDDGKRANRPASQGSGNNEPANTGTVTRR